MMESSWIQDQLATLFGESVKLLDLFLFADFGTGIPLVVAILFSLNGELRDIFTAYRREVEAGQFPAGDNAVHMEPGKLKKFQDLLGEKREV